MNPEIETLIQRLNEARKGVEDMLPQVDPRKEIYPGWTIREYLAHMSGWDDAVIDMLRAHMGEYPVEMSASRGIDYYNEHSVASREGLDLGHIQREWRQTRETMKQVLGSMDDQKFHTIVAAPWGGEGSITEMIEIFIGHEHEHARHLIEWLQNPDQPLVGKH